ncbi:ATP-binding cassette domain-containing protein [Branchiibius cervicis]|uniref:ATP-binding cassette domain-containing protein n=1 Tax=Branchiibius cervicis TaxID=908252 RepID=A0ABW2APW3_9MICO
MTSVSFYQVSYRYPRSSRVALSDISFGLSPGVTGLIGVNGAGKSTLMELIATMRAPSSGRIEWDPAGSSIRTIQERVSLVPQSATLPRGFSVYDFLRYSCFLKAVPRSCRESRIADSIDKVHLTDMLKEKCGSLSGGQARRVVIAWGLLSQPEVLLLDEPTAGLDVYQRRSVRELVKSGLAPVTLISSHLLGDLLGVAQNMLVLNNGKLHYQGSMAEAVELIEATGAPKDSEEQFIALLEGSEEGRSL